LEKMSNPIFPSRTPSEGLAPTPAGEDIFWTERFQQFPIAFEEIACGSFPPPMLRNPTASRTAADIIALVLLPGFLNHAVLTRRLLSQAVEGRPRLPRQPGSGRARGQRLQQALRLRLTDLLQRLDAPQRL
jgi:hypothetical protein